MGSIWNEAFLPAFAPLEGDLKTDVAIIGGGMCGILCAHFLRKAGVDYVLLESDRVCRGTTLRTTAKITAQHGLIYHDLLRKFGTERARMYYEANTAAINTYRELAQSIPCDFEEQDSFVYSLDRPEKLEAEMDAMEHLHCSPVWKKDLSLPFSTAGAVGLTRQAQFDPLRFASGILPGLHICEHTAARAFHGRRILTDRGAVTAEKIIVATHFPILNKHGAYFLKLYQHRSYVLALKNVPLPDGMYVDEAEGGLSFRTYANTLLLGGAGHRTGKKSGAWQELEAFSRKAYPLSRPVCRWAAQDCMTLDGVPYIGPYSGGTENLYVATGFNKWGMTSSMTAAMVLCDLVQGKEHPYAPLFSPQRSMLQPQLARNILESAVNFLTPTAPRCPHLGCALKWNPHEHSWDCSCHGSRFTEDGHLLENPSTGNLKRK